MSLRTFIINRDQVVALRNEMIGHGNIEAKDFTGSNLSFIWKCINLGGFPESKTKMFMEKYPYLKDFDIMSIKRSTPVKASKESEGATEMKNPAKDAKHSFKNKEHKIAA